MDTVYNAELTFTPKLNEASKRLAEKSALKWKNHASALKKSRQRAVVAEANAAFTFHPEMNSRSQKIISRIRRYEEINGKESDPVQLSFEDRDDVSVSLGSEDNMNLASREPSFETASVHVSQEAENFIQEVLSSCNGDKSSSEEQETSSITPESFKIDVTSSQVELSKPLPRKTLNLPNKLPYNNTDYLHKIKCAKEIALNAIRLKKIFTILGPYPYLRKSLQRRGWVEKFGHHSAQPILGSPQAIRPRPAKKKKKVAATKVASSTSESDGDMSSESEDEDDPTNNPDFNRIVSRLLKDISPTFIWTIKRDDIDFKYLNRDQIVNHYCKASSFTTKIGLCQHLRSLPWFDNSNPLEFFPRCYQLYNEEDRDDFIADFETCSSLAILKLYIKQYDEHHQKKDDQLLKMAASSEEIPEEKAENCVPLTAVDLAVNHLKHILKYAHNEFLDVQPDPSEDPLSNLKRKQILNFSYSLANKKYKFERFSKSSYDLASMLIDSIAELGITQEGIDGLTNTWIMKPGAKSRGRGVIPQNNLSDIIKLADSSKEEKWVVQKYIEKPLLVYNVKFDIRQWFMVTDWNPLTLYFYQDSYLRFGSKAFTLEDFDPSIHLCNNSIQKKFMSPQSKNETSFAQGNMWTCQAFKKHLDKQGNLDKWDDIIYPGMKKSIQRVMMTIQDVIEDRKNSFELYGADFMIDTDYNPWLIEINCSPAMGGTTRVTEKLCSEVLDDVIKVLIDRRENKLAPTGKWELCYKQSMVTVPPYIGVQLALEGKYVPKPTPARRKGHPDPDVEKVSIKKIKSPRQPKPEVITPKKLVVKKETDLKSKIASVTVSSEAKTTHSSIGSKNSEKFQKELISSIAIKTSPGSLTRSYPLSPSVSLPATVPAKHETALPSILSSSNELRSSPHLSMLSISPISVNTDEKWSVKKEVSSSHQMNRVSDLIPKHINPYRLQQIISRKTKPKDLDMLTLQNRYSTSSTSNKVSSVKLLDVQPKRKAKVKKVTKSLSKLSNCPHCDTKSQTGIILNLLKSAPAKPASHSIAVQKVDNNQRPKKHFRVSLSQVASMSHSVVDIEQTGSSLKIVGEQTTN